MILAGVLLVLCSFEIGEIEAGIRYRRDCGYGCDRYGTTTIIKKIYLGGGRRRGYRRRYRPPRVRQWYTPVPVPVPVPGPTVVITPPMPLWKEYEVFHRYGCDNCPPPPPCETGNCGGGGYAPPPIPQGPPPVPPMPGPGCATGTCGTGYQGSCPPPVPAPGCATGTCGGGYQPPPYGGVMAAKAPASLVPNDVPEQAMELNAKQNT
ncbi:hypothetical protein ANCCAN_11683 [Ancylostoma caninum]|uniref:Uncharacterized protein n=1 Tax=Ancylostoma caninum TaxID=29170 RepID=A0A368GF92_ANCCA|nr:hypothetical protein ANCCAN_11683 [Ancylostoma caninum]